jgi:hypothetical protein
MLPSSRRAGSVPADPGRPRKPSRSRLGGTRAGARRAGWAAPGLAQPEPGAGVEDSLSYTRPPSCTSRRWRPGSGQRLLVAERGAEQGRGGMIGTPWAQPATLDVGARWSMSAATNSRQARMWVQSESMPGSGGRRLSRRRVRCWRMCCSSSSFRPSRSWRPPTRVGRSRSARPGWAGRGDGSSRPSARGRLMPEACRLP